MNNRKDEHVELAKKMYEDNSKSDFDNLKFVYNSLSQISLADVDLKTMVANLEMDYPFFINAMTGGSEKTKLINEQLAYIAKETNIAMASGSLSAALKDEGVKDSFKVIRDINKEGLIFANIGAEYSKAKANKATDILDADALQIHLNVIQELIMPEGDRDFSNWLNNIEEIIKEVSIPVIVKEVGFGMSRETIKQLVDVGVKSVDISGFGGTNFASIENSRRKKAEFDYLKNFGQSTVISLLEAQGFVEKIDIIASGGIRNPLDIIKSLAMGAKAVGISAFFLTYLLDHGVEETIELINSWKQELKVIMTILGKTNIDQLKDLDIIVLKEAKDWCIARDIDYKKFANRSSKQ